MAREVVLSVVVPAHDEAPNLERLVGDVRDAIEPTGLSWELVVVDDGSGDDSPARLAALARSEPRLRTVRLANRSGQTRALDAGFESARGSLIATCDADLQCPPGAIPALIALLRDSGADMACGIRTPRQDPTSRRIASALANLVRRSFIAPTLRDLACPLRVFRADARRSLAIPSFDGAHRWLPALFVLAGLRVVQRPVPHGPRLAGRSKYTNRGRIVPIARETCLVIVLAMRRRLSWRVAAVSASLGPMLG
jgi:dolichol-phosphate mannosyltransferase